MGRRLSIKESAVCQRVSLNAGAEPFAMAMAQVFPESSKICRNDLYNFREYNQFN
jgi:hypothetical protein